MDAHEDKVRRTFGERSKFYKTSSAHADPEVLNKLIRIASPQASWEMLDVATGAGHTAFAFAPYVHHIIGIDLTPKMLIEAENLRVSKKITNVEFQVGDVHELPFGKSFFDLVTCRRAPHHFSDISIALREMARVLKPQSTFIIEDRSIPEEKFIDQMMNRLDLLHDESHVREYRQSEWQTFLTEAGFQVEVMELSSVHRPLTSLTDGIPSENVAQIHELISKMSVPEKMLMNIKIVNGELYINHWFIMIKARKI